MAQRGPLIGLMVAIAAVAVVSAQVEVISKPQNQNTTELLRIAGGDEVVKRDMFPFMVYVHPIKLDGEGLICGGSIIHESWIMSAAHCFTEHAPDEDNDPEGFCNNVKSIEIYAGLLDRDDRLDNVQKNIITEDEFRDHLFIHPDYKKNAKRSSDIALIKLKKSLAFNDRVGKIDRATDSDFKAGIELTASGWGRTSSGDLPHILNYVEGLKLISREDCENEHGKTKITDRNICHTGITKNVCKGDSGGPVITRSPSSNKNVQIGIVSWGDKGCPSGSHAVMVDVAKFSYWIDYTMSNSPCPCEDSSSSCSRYVREGRCNEEKVMRKCRKSCTLCDSPRSCEDSSSSCSRYVKEGRCNEEKVVKNCRKSCTLCGCESPWVSIRSQGCFLFVDDIMNWDGAKSYCESKGGDLAILDSKSKRASIVNYMECSGLWDDHQSQWLGANNRKSNTWCWIDNNPVNDGWKTFGRNQPDSGEDVCMELYAKLNIKTNQKEDYKLLSDTSCRREKYFICEK